VIGGGFAGLSAATALAERGAGVTVLEARPGLGGRASAFTDPATGERVDNGQHVLFGCYHATFAFLERLGTASQVHLQEDLAIQIVERDGRASRLVCSGAWPAPLHLLAGAMRWPALGWRDRWSMLAVGRAIRSRPRGEGSGSGTSRTVRQWLRDQGQTERVIELLWEPLAVAALNQQIDTAAADPFVNVLRQMFSTNRRDSAIGFPLVPLAELYAEPSRVYIEARGGQVRTGEAAVVTLAGGDLQVHTKAGTMRPAAVIAAVAWHALPDLFPDPPRQLESAIDAARRTAASPIVTVNLWFDRPVTTDVFVGLPGRAMQWIFDKQRLFGAGSRHLSLVSSGAGAIAGRSNEELTALAMREIREALPAARAAVLERAVVVRERRASFSLAPGQPARPPSHTAVPGLFLAGDWIETGLPATIESAVVSGHTAADLAAAHLAVRDP
jgi:squalene-associated FAD-dependent desaturase